MSRIERIGHHSSLLQRCRKHDDDFDDFRVRLAATGAHGLCHGYARSRHPGGARSWLPN
jgi:hypothetical protein